MEQALQLDLLGKRSRKERASKLRFFFFRLTPSLLVIMSHFAGCSIVDSPISVPDPDPNLGNAKQYAAMGLEGLLLS